MAYVAVQSQTRWAGERWTPWQDSRILAETPLGHLLSAPYGQWVILGKTDPTTGVLVRWRYRLAK